MPWASGNRAWLEPAGAAMWRRASRNVGRRIEESCSVARLSLSRLHRWFASSPAPQGGASNRTVHHHDSHMGTSAGAHVPTEPEYQLRYVEEADQCPT